MALRPDTASVFVIDGTRGNDGAVEAEIRRQWPVRGQTPTLEFLHDLPLSELASRVASLPEHAVVLFVRQTMLTSSQDIDQFEAQKVGLGASGVPVFSQVEDFLGHGVVGGHVWRWDPIARQMAETAIRIANGEKASDIPPGRAVYETTLDWYQLQRWQIPGSRVPA